MTGSCARIIFYLIFFLYLPLQSVAQARIEKIEFASGFTLSHTELLKAAGLKTGQPILPRQIPILASRLEESLFNDGYLFARVDSISVKSLSQKNQIQLFFFGASGPSTVIGHVELKSDSIESKLYLRDSALQPGFPYQPALIEKSIRHFLELAGVQGFLFADASVADLKIRQGLKQNSVDLFLQVNEGKLVHLQRVIVEGNLYTKRDVVLRELPLQQGQKIDTKILEQIPARLRRLNLFRAIEPVQLLRTSADSVILKIKVEEGNATTFDGVVGYIPEASSGQNGYFTGLVDIAFNNLFGSARQFNVHWKRPDALSEEFRTAYTEPWVLGYPLALGMELERTVRDTSFIQWGYGLNWRFRILQDLSIIGRFSQSSYVPDSSASRDFRLLKNKVFDAQIGLEYDTRDDRLNPRSGIYYRSSYSAGIKHNSGPAYVIEEDSLLRRENLQTIRMQIQFYYNLWVNQVIAVQAEARRIRGSRLQLTDYFWFGGSRTLRGYRENQFRGDLVVWSSYEYRFLMAGNARLFMFTDWGYYHYQKANQNISSWLGAYGIGVRFDTPAGVLGVDIALGKDDTFREAKIHFGLINQF